MPTRTFRLPPVIKSLSARLLVLTVFFVMLSELFIYAPSVARYRKVYLEDRIADAHLATLTLETTEDRMLGPELEAEVLRQAKARQIVLREPGEISKVLMTTGAPVPDVRIDLTKQSFSSYLFDGFGTLFQTENRILLVTGQSPHQPDVTIEVLLDETPMRLEMYDYSGRILQLSIIISLFTASLVYLSLQLLMVFPMRRLTESIVEFRDDPENSTATVDESGRSDEIGVAQTVVADMLQTIRGALRQKTRLAALGTAVAKINHDLRNILSPAQLLSDRLVNSDDPEVRRIAPRLVAAIDRAVDLSVRTLDFVTDSGPVLDFARFPLAELVNDVGSTVENQGEGLALRWVNRIQPDVELVGDRAQLYRVLVNLGRNALEAGADQIEVTAVAGENEITIDILDDGPGLSQQAQARLFQPFSGSTRTDGSGLGLAISDEIVRAHGGTLRLVSTGETGTCFRISLPVRPHTNS